MKPQNIYESKYVTQLKENLEKEESLNLYLLDESPFTDDNTLIIPNLDISENCNLKIPDGNNLYNFENAQIIFETYKKMTPVQATDTRLWTYLTHTTFWNYMRVRCPIEKEPNDTRQSYILRHWFVNRINPVDLTRNNISMLWWCTHLTYDSERDDSYELTKEFFSHMNYTRVLATYSLPRYTQFIHAVLEYVIENNEIFSKYKEKKIETLMKKINFVAGYKAIHLLSKEEIKTELLSRFNDDIKKVVVESV